MLESVAGAGLSEADAARFVGGHPLAGAEAAGVEHARADLFEGATWYLTPTERTSGVHYDRLYRTISALGARPSAIAAETHDRLMATVSHLPHVLANVLVSQAATSAARGGAASARDRPELPRRDAGGRREPGAVARHLRRQPGGDRAELDAYVAALEAVRERLRAGDADADRALDRGARAPTASACSRWSSPAAR